jgi:hypothetical protein
MKITGPKELNDCRGHNFFYNCCFPLSILNHPIALTAKKYAQAYF